MRLVDLDDIQSTLIEYGQHDNRFTLRETIKYSPTEVREILENNMTIINQGKTAKDEFISNLKILIFDYVMSGNADNTTCGDWQRVVDEIERLCNSRK